MKKLCFDLETSGLVATKHSILTAYFCIIDDNFNVIDELDIKLKPDDGVLQLGLNVDQQALDVNGINIDKHLADPNTLPYTEAKKAIVAFWKKHHTGGRWPTLRPCGHNIPFDLNFLAGQLGFDEDERKKLGVHYQVLDTQPICNHKKEIGAWPEKIARLGDIVDFLGVKKRAAHNAKEDTLMWIDCYKEIVRQDKALMAGSTTASVVSTISDELVILEL